MAASWALPPKMSQLPDHPARGWPWSAAADPITSAKGMYPTSSGSMVSAPLLAGDEQPSSLGGTSGDVSQSVMPSSSSSAFPGPSSPDGVEEGRGKAPSVRSSHLSPTRATQP